MMVFQLDNEHNS